MSLSLDELLRLQNLCKINLNDIQTKKFFIQIDGIINFLDKLKELDIPSDFVGSSDLHKANTFVGIQKFDDTKMILDNVEHELINNSITIKSVLDN